MTDLDTIGPIDPDTGRWKGVPAPDVIEEIERAGGSAFVNAGGRVLPVRTLEGTDEPYAALGIELGAPLPQDPIFRYAQLPDGWTLQLGGHENHLWSYVLDSNGVERVAVFFKAAPYDRNAHMSIVVGDRAPS